MSMIPVVSWRPLASQTRVPLGRELTDMPCSTFVMRPYCMKTSAVIHEKPLPALASSADVPAAGSPTQTVALVMSVGLWPSM